MQKVLVIEDEEKISSIVKVYLEKEGFTVSVAETGQEGLSLLKEGFDLLILDLMLPDMDGEEICELVRKESNLPIIMLTAKSDEDDRVKGLSIGADDYVVKPFSPRELVARVKALLRRSTDKKPLLSFNNHDIEIDPERFEVRRAGKPVVLTSTEFKLLLYMAEKPGHVFSRENLINRILGFDYEGYDRTIDAHIKNLRHKIGDHPRKPTYIQTVYGVGYKFVGIPDED